MSSNGVYAWSKTASQNASSDNAINWAEGQSPSSVNNSARAEMASVAKWRDDISGSLTTSGTSTAYTVALNQAPDSISVLDGQMVAFTPHATNGATVTLDAGFGAKPLRSAPGADLPAATLIQGSPYVATYYNSSGEFILHGFHKLPEVIPIGGCIPYLGTTVPNNNFAFPFGQTFSRTTYSKLFALVGTTFGSGDGSTTFNGPDIRGRSFFGLDNMGGTAANRITSGGSGIAGATVGAAGGTETHTLTRLQLPSTSMSSVITAQVPAQSLGSNRSTVLTNATGARFLNSLMEGSGSGVIAESLVVNFPTTAVTITGTLGGDVPHQNMPPAFVCPVIMRII